MCAPGSEKGPKQREKALQKRVKAAYRNLKKANTELRNRIDQLSAFHRISLAMRYSSTNPQQLWEMMLEEALELLRGDSGAIYLAEGGVLRVQAARGLSADAVSDLEMPIGHGVVGHVAKSGEALLVPDVSKEPRYEVLTEGIQSEVAAPMAGGESIIGVINVESRKLGAFKPSDKELLMTLAAHAARVWENAMLYQMAQQRNQQLLESYEKLREAQQELIRKERLAALGEMAATVAHEIRNPMTAIRGFAQRIGRRLHDPATADKYLNIIISEVDRLDEVIRSVLDFGKRPVMRKQAARIDGIIREALLILDDKIKRKSLKVKKRIDERLPLVMLDEDQMKQVIINLLQNAVDVTPRGELMVIEAASRNTGLMIRVSDTGSGITPEITEKIFEPFFTTKAKGTGLGLAMVQRIVEEHNGTINVDNLPGKGAAFTVHLPLHGGRETRGAARRSRRDGGAGFQTEREDTRPTT